MNLIFFLATMLQQAGVAPDRFNGYLILGYLVMGGIGLIYIITLALRQRNLQQDLRLMNRLLQEDEE